MRFMRPARAAAILIALAWVLPALAATNVFGPKRYALDRGKPAAFEETILIDGGSRCDGRASFVLAVENDSVSSAEVTLGGVAIFSEADFNAAVKKLEAPVALADANALAIKLKGGTAAGALTVTIRREIEQAIAPPQTLRLASPRQTFEITIAANPASRHVLFIDNPAGLEGSVAVNGATVAAFKASERLVRREVALQAANQARIELRGRAGDAATIAFREILDESVCAPRIAIDSPASNAIVRGTQVPVSGTVTGGRDVGVTVNGRAAELDLAHAGTAADPYRWATDIPAEPGPLTLHAIVRTAAGVTATDSRPVIVEADPEEMRLIALPPAEIVPAKIEFRLDGVAAGATLYEIDYDGNGAFEVTAPALPPLVQQYITAGLRRVTVRVTAPSGVRTASAWVNVSDFVTIHAILQQRWNAFRAALSRRDVGAALELMNGDAAREKYGRAFTLLLDRLPQIAATMDPIHPVYIHGDFAKYLLTRIEDGREHGYYVYFIRSEDGLWRIAQF